MAQATRIHVEQLTGLGDISCLCVRETGSMLMATGYGVYRNLGCGEREVPTAVRSVWECYMHAQVTQWVGETQQDRTRGEICDAMLGGSAGTPFLSFPRRVSAL